MKSIVAVNTFIPTIDNHVDFHSDDSLIDYDIILFDLKYPSWLLDRIHFSGGGSAIDLDSGRKLLSYIEHWKKEIQVALTAGKSVFVILNTRIEDTVATGSSSPRKNERLYSSVPISNYDVLPVTVRARNAKGRLFKLRDNRFHDIHKCLDKYLEYRVIVESEVRDTVFTTRDDKGILGGILNPGHLEGHLVLLPFFDPPYEVEENEEENEEYAEESDEENEDYSEEILEFSHALVSALIEMDRILLSSALETPKPNWLGQIELPEEVKNFDAEIQSIDNKISNLEERKSSIVRQRNELTEYQDLLFETGARLENAISKSLVLMGFKVENFREGDLEIDHVFSGSTGIRLIGEAEGRDRSAISISKFRQLESNVLEDLARDEIDEPAKPVLFGNGYRLEAPESRKMQFTEKCLKNAKRSGAALVQTTDLYQAVICILNNENDVDFRLKCQKAIEQTCGDLVMFPKEHNRN